VYRRVFHYPTPGSSNNPALAPVPVFINEWMADNINTLADPADLQNEDWFELYNPGPEAVDLTGYILTDSTTLPSGTTIPEGYVIPPGGYLLVWADGEPGQNRPDRPDLHVNFALNRQGDAIRLFTPQGVLVDAVVFGPQAPDVSEGRYPNGGPVVGRLSRPTPRASNAPGLVAQNTPPVLGLLPHRRLLAGQTLSFAVTATDAETAASNLVYTLGPGAPAGAMLSAGGQFTWTPLAPGTNQIWVLVTDGGTPPLTTSNFFIVRVGAPPHFEPGALRLEQGRLQLRLQAMDGLEYRLEYKEALEEAQWRLLQTMMPSNGWMNYSESITNRQRFYRLLQTPAP
ncbi:MAG: lamin tail domain-containing protein, partial [Verrucomicrobiae bacterium]|nr:lamin tail domain-containing protein [Verrucomicrobiae bacterium]